MRNEFKEIASDPTLLEFLELKLEHETIEAVLSDLKDVSLMVTKLTEWYYKTEETSQSRVAAQSIEYLLEGDDIT
jgi:hypothetical protein